MVATWLQLLGLIVLLFSSLANVGAAVTLYQIAQSLIEERSRRRRSDLEQELAWRDLEQQREQLRAEELDWVATRRGSSR